MRAEARRPSAALVNRSREGAHQVSRIVRCFAHMCGHKAHESSVGNNLGIGIKFWCVCTFANLEPAHREDPLQLVSLVILYISSCVFANITL